MSKISWVAVTLIAFAVSVVAIVEQLPWQNNASLEIGTINIVSETANVTLEDVKIKGTWSTIDSLFMSSISRDVY